MIKVDKKSFHVYNNHSKFSERVCEASLYKKLKGHAINNNLSYYVETYGCQMNAHESEKLAGILESNGYIRTEEKLAADLILFNTCCIREHAEAKLYGNLGALKDHKISVPGAVIGVFGCMMQQPGAAKKLVQRFPFVDIVFGSNHLHLLSDMLEQVYFAEQTVLITDPDETIVENLPATRNSMTSAFVNIIYGCNNFCTYCVVPYVRGRERSRKSIDIISEIQSLCKQGVTEVTLLGQNVNTYGKDLTQDLSFSQLLEKIDTETDINRLRFMTSHPKDLTDDVIDCYGLLGSLCEHIHLPVQSGSDRILKNMNRRYGKEQYLLIVDKLRHRVPDIAITTDIIVGFPGETENDFSETLDLVTRVGFDAAYTFAYSSRPMTRAAHMPDHVDRQTKKDRLARLNALVTQGMMIKNRDYLYRTVEVLATGCSKRDQHEIYGTTRGAKSVNFPGSMNDIGQYINVKIDAVKMHTLHGLQAAGERESFE